MIPSVLPRFILVLCIFFGFAQGRTDGMGKTMFQGDVTGGTEADEAALAAVPDGTGGVAIPFAVGPATRELYLHMCTVVRLDDPTRPRSLKGWYPLYGTQAGAAADAAVGTGVSAVVPPGSRVTFYMPDSPVSTAGRVCQANVSCVTLETSRRRKLLAVKKRVAVSMFGVVAPSIKILEYHAPPAPGADPWAPPLAPPAPGWEGPPAPDDSRAGGLGPPPTLTGRLPHTAVGILVGASMLACCLAGLVVASRNHYVEEPFRGVDMAVVCEPRTVSL